MCLKYQPIFLISILQTHNNINIVPRRRLYALQVHRKIVDEPQYKEYAVHLFISYLLSPTTRFLVGLLYFTLSSSGRADRQKKEDALIASGYYTHQVKYCTYTF